MWLCCSPRQCLACTRLFQLITKYISHAASLVSPFEKLVSTCRDIVRAVRVWLYKSFSVIFYILPWSVFLYVTKLLGFAVISWNGSQPISGAFFGWRVFFVVFTSHFFSYITFSCVILNSSSALFLPWEIHVGFLSLQKYFPSLPRWYGKRRSVTLPHSSTAPAPCPYHCSQQELPGGRNSDATTIGIKPGFQGDLSPALHFPTASWVNWPVQYTRINFSWVFVCIKHIL